MPEATQPKRFSPVRFGTNIVVLPSENRVRARRPSLLSLILSGGFPSDLTALAWQMYKNAVADAAKDETPEDLLAMARFTNAYVSQVLVDPKIGEVTEVTIDKDGVCTGTVRLEDIPDLDKRWLLVWGQSIATSRGEEVFNENLDTFREDTGGNDVGPGGAAVPAAAVEPDRAPALSDGA